MPRRPITIWTIGHSNRPLDEFLALLGQCRIEILVDVRHYPGSRRWPHFNKETLQRVLSEAGVRYEHLVELGGRRRARLDSTNTLWESDSFRGYADYMETQPFREGIDRLLGLARQGRTAFMCSEALWWRCHRSLIADYLKAMGTTVHHILGPGKLQEHPYTSPARVIGGRLSYGGPPISPPIDDS